MSGKQICKKCGSDWARNAVGGQCRICGSRFATYAQTGYKISSEADNPSDLSETGENTVSTEGGSHGQPGKPDNSYSLKRHLYKLLLSVFVLASMFFIPTLEQKHKRQFDNFAAPVVKPVDRVLDKLYTVLISPFYLFTDLEFSDVLDKIAFLINSDTFDQSSLPSIRTGIGWKELDGSLAPEEGDFDLEQQYTWGLKIARLWRQDAMLYRYAVRNIESSMSGENSSFNFQQSPKGASSWMFYSPSGKKKYNDLSMSKNKNLPVTDLWIKYESGKYRIIAFSKKGVVYENAPAPERLSCSFSGVIKLAIKKYGLWPSSSYDIEIHSGQVRRGKWRIRVARKSGLVYMPAGECTG